MKSWWGIKTLIKISVPYLVDHCSGVGSVWSTTTRTRVCDGTAVTFSVKCFNPLKLYFLSGNIFRKWFASYFLFIHEHLILMWSSAVNLIAVTTLLLTSSVHRCQQRIFKENADYFYAVRISFLLAILSIIFILTGYVFQELCKKTKVAVFYLNTVYLRIHYIYLTI